jgi:Fe(3+) dicitrate transport protein
LLQCYGVPVRGIIFVGGRPDHTLLFIRMNIKPFIKNVSVFFALTPTLALEAQEDSSRLITAVNITELAVRKSVERLPEVQGTYIFSGKKTEVLNIQGSNSNLADKIARQVFAQIPGIFVYDMDGTGNQINIATRGLDPHRGWEFNMRQNGFLSNTDMYGYPASHYGVPLEAVERIELVRGTGSLQYGAQFGGMLNYITSQTDSTRRFSGKVIQTVGSYGLVNAFLSAGGRVGKIRYNAYYNRRVSQGYRKNGESSGENYMLQLAWHPIKNLVFQAQIGSSYYRHQLPGPLNDSMFHVDPKASTRARNYYSPDIYLPAFSVHWNPGANTKIQWSTSAILGSRNSVMFDKASTVVDAIDSTTGLYAARQVDIDKYRSLTSELRVLQAYNLGKMRSHIAFGIQVMNNDLHRMQQGKGSTGSDWDLALQNGTSWGRDVHLRTKNLAVFAENHAKITKDLSVNLGMRYEKGQSEMTGKIAYLSDEQIPNVIQHDFPLFGASVQYTPLKNRILYGGWSQAYRPVIFKDIIPASIYERVSKDLKDAHGYNSEIGFRGETQHWKWDIGLFQLLYRNRMGTVSSQDSSGQYLVLHANIGDSRNRGIEIFLRYNLKVAKYTMLSVFTSTSIMNAVYLQGQVRHHNENISVAGRRVESAPELITRNGINIIYRRWSGSILCSYTASTYADALNTEKPDAAGAVGLVPAYTLLDMSLAYKVGNNIAFRFSANNIANASYYTKRPQFYPGPGIWPSDGRTIQGSVCVGF